MIGLPNALRAWGSDAFAQALKAELEALKAGALPLDAAATPGCHIDDAPVSVSVTRTAADAQGIQVRLGVFFTETVASCGCGDDPFQQSAYCELDVVIDRATGAASFSIVRD